MSNKSDKFILVFNIKDDTLASIKNYFHRSIRPSTYKCNLNALLTGPLGLKSDWKNFVEKLPFNVEYLHKDGFKDTLEFNDVEFPSIFLSTNGELKLFITQEEINASNSIEELKTIFYDRMVQFGL
ncbi:MAG: hypothetical protein GF311_11320 [Candidatus Lokiarchaeota archaeon]|nr:hypothetical protein [Candidatus Lokiarchaeota archaeon]